MISLTGKCAVLISTMLLGHLAGCSAPRPVAPVDPELAGALNAAGIAFDRGDIAAASDQYQRALMRAWAMDNPAAITDAAYNLAACLTELGRYEKARTELIEAKAEADRAGIGTVDLLLVEATVARLQGKPGEAKALVDEVLNNPHLTPSQRLQARIIQAEIDCDAQDAAGAAEHLKGADGGPGTSMLLRARLAGVEGRIHVLKHEWTDAAAQFDRSAELLRQSGRYAAMWRALADAARALQSAEQHAAAADRFYRAARSALALGEIAESRKLVEATMTEAEKARADELKGRAAALSAQIAEAAK